MAVADSVPDRLMTVAEEIVFRVHSAYTDDVDGLVAIGKSLGITIEVPRSKVSVMLVGNHSAGKSSFINWYIGEYVQLESVAMETNSFTFVSHGKRRETFKGRATIKHKPWLADIESFPGAIDNLSTQISSSRHNLFAMCDFVDTPGLTDGSLKYPYPVNEILEWLGIRADLILVFFDPHGQALCARTMNVVHRLNKNCKPKTHYFLTMADKISSEKERSKVILQVAQSLSHAQTRPSTMSGNHHPDAVAVDHQGQETWLGEHALRVRPIYIPEKVQHGADLSPDFNRIDEVLELIADAVNQNVQNHIERFENDSLILLDSVNKCLTRYEWRRRINDVIGSFRMLCLILTWSIPMILSLYLFYMIHPLVLPKEFLGLPWVQKMLQTAMASFTWVAEQWPELIQIERAVVFRHCVLVFLIAAAAAVAFGKLIVGNISPRDARRLYTHQAQLRNNVEGAVALEDLLLRFHL